MPVARAFLKWFAIGMATSAFLLWTQANAVGGVAGLLQVGTQSDLRPLVENELGAIPLVDGKGHDGQIYYAMGLDLGGDEVPELLDHGGYRYRRILYPAVASGLGVLEGHALLWGMVVTTIVATGLAAGAIAAIAVNGAASEWLTLALLLNPGVWLSVRLMTADTLALALMLLGVLAVVMSRGRAWAAFALSALSKDVYLATPGGLAVSRDRRRWLLFLAPLAVLVVWMAWVTFSIGEGFTGRGNLALPFSGIIEASDNWGNLGAGGIAYVIFALASVIAGLVFAAIRKSWLRWSVLSWAMLGVLSSNWVWDFGNNAARVFAPIAVLLALGFIKSPVTTEMQTSTSRPS